MITVRKTDPFSAEVAVFIAALDHYHEELYPSEFNHLDSVEALAEDNCYFIGAYKGTELVGIAASKDQIDYAEVKRMYVPEKYRGQGISEGLLAAIEYHNLFNGTGRLCLETGTEQAAAISLYKKHGFSEIESFGEYKAGTGKNLYFEKDLTSVIKTESFNKIIEEHLYDKLVQPEVVVAVAFTSELNSGIESEYGPLAKKMKSLALEQEGLLAVDSHRSHSKGYTLSLWNGSKGLSQWAQDPKHIEAQKLGREKFYKSYITRKFIIERD